MLLGLVTLARLPVIKRDDAIATAGLFGAVSASALGPAMVLLEQLCHTFKYRALRDDYNFLWQRAFYSRTFPRDRVAGGHSDNASIGSIQSSVPLCSGERRNL